MANPRDLGLIYSAFIGSDEILFDLVSPENLPNIIFSPLVRDHRYSAIAHMLPASARSAAINPEVLVQSKPRVVFIADYTSEETQHLLKSLGIRVVRLKTPVNLQDISDNIMLVGKSIGLEAAGTDLVDVVTNRFSFIKSKCNLAGKTYMNFSRDYMLMGKNTGFDFIITSLGGKNLTSEQGQQGFSQWSPESVAILKPDALIASENDLPSDQIAALKKDRIWGKIPAIRAGKVIRVPSANLSSVTHYILGALESVCSQDHAN